MPEGGAVGLVTFVLNASHGDGTGRALAEGCNLDGGFFEAQLTGGSPFRVAAPYCLFQWETGSARGARLD
jgi:hypothetical protein